MRAAVWIGPAIVGCLWVGALPARSDDAPAARRYKLSIHETMEVKPAEPGQEAQPLAIEADRQIVYANEPRPTGLLVRLDSTEISAKAKGATTVHTRMSRAGAQVELPSGGMKEMPYDQAPPRLRRLLDDFGKPIVAITLNPDGSEKERKLLVADDSELARNGMIEDMRLFHAPFPAGKAEWDAPARLTIGHGQYARGRLHYRKVEGAGDGPVTVDVSGTLTPFGEVGQGEISAGSYKVSGQQVYDPKARDWVSGKLDVDLTFEVSVKTQPASKTTGHAVMTLQPLAPAEPLLRPDQIK